MSTQDLRRGAYHALVWGVAGLAVAFIAGLASTLPGMSRSPPQHQIVLWQWFLHDCRLPVAVAGWLMATAAAATFTPRICCGFLRTWMIVFVATVAALMAATMADAPLEDRRQAVIEWPLLVGVTLGPFLAMVAVVYWRIAVPERRGGILRRPSSQDRQGDAWWEPLAGLALTTAATMTLYPALARAPEAAIRGICAQNLSRIAAALAAYEHANGATVSDVVGTDGKPLLSWRVALLPYLGEADLFKKFRLDEPWDSQHNLALLHLRPAVWACPYISESRTVTAYSLTRGADGVMLSEPSSGEFSWTRPEDGAPRVPGEGKTTQIRHNGLVPRIIVPPADDRERREAAELHVEWATDAAVAQP